jgi:hypothetical protein
LNVYMYIYIWGCANNTTVGTVLKTDPRTVVTNRGVGGPMASFGAILDQSEAICIENENPNLGNGGGQNIYAYIIHIYIYTLSEAILLKLKNAGIHQC